MTALLRWLLDGRLEVAGSAVLWREVIGNVFGLASALLGMRRFVWAWPVGMLGNALLFTVFLGGAFATPQAVDLYGQAGRQVSFFAVSAYGWWRWSHNRRQGGAPAGGAVVPRWATGPERLALAGVAVLGTALAYPILAAMGSWGPLPDAWILVGSLLATYGMARGWVEFWLVWIAVDAVGVPLLLNGRFYPSAVMYGVYGVFCAWGFIAWLRASRALAPAPSTEATATSYAEATA
jgi:nicotinamide mononucleotide transporter